jgi:hypothetical protein
MKWKLKLAWFVFGIILVLVSIIPVKIAIAFHQVPVPQAIFVLGGNGICCPVLAISQKFRYLGF